ncbi:MAG: hypothetical protein AABX86_00300 [Nanoarchaeota archaeon]
MRMKGEVAISHLVNALIIVGLLLVLLLILVLILGRGGSIVERFDNIWRVFT